MNNYDKTKSRKWRLVLLVFWVSSFALLIPPILSAFVFKIQPLILLKGSELVSLWTLIVTSYFGTNVFQKHVELKNLIKPKEESDKNKEESDKGKEA